MLDTKSLHDILLDIYGIEQKYLVPLDTDWYVPTYDKNNKVGTWLGYRILSVKPIVRASYVNGAYVKSVKGIFRLSFVGRQAEEFALQTILFDDRTDVQDAFAKHQIQLNYVEREVLTYPIKEGGLNNSLCWFTDIPCQTFYEAKVKYGKWTDKPPVPPETWIPKQPEHSKPEGWISSGSLIIHR